MKNKRKSGITGRTRRRDHAIFTPVEIVAPRYFPSEGIWDAYLDFTKQSLGWK